MSKCCRTVSFLKKWFSLRTVSCLVCPSQCNCFCKNTWFLYIHVSVRTFYIYIVVSLDVSSPLIFSVGHATSFPRFYGCFCLTGASMFNPLQVAKEAILRVGNALRVYHKGARVRILSTFIRLIHHLNPRSMDWPGMDNLQLAANVEGVPYHCSRNKKSPKSLQPEMVTSLIIITFNQPPKLKPLCTSLHIHFGQVANFMMPAFTLDPAKTFRSGRWGWFRVFRCCDTDFGTRRSWFPSWLDPFGQVSSYQLHDFWVVDGSRFSFISSSHITTMWHPLKWHEPPNYNKLEYFLPRNFLLYILVFGVDCHLSSPSLMNLLGLAQNLPVPKNQGCHGWGSFGPISSQALRCWIGKPTWLPGWRIAISPRSRTCPRWCTPNWRPRHGATEKVCSRTGWFSCYTDPNWQPFPTGQGSCWLQNEMFSQRWQRQAATCPVRLGSPNQMSAYLKLLNNHLCSPCLSSVVI